MVLLTTGLWTGHANRLLGAHIVAFKSDNREVRNRSFETLARLYFPQLATPFYYTHNLLVQKMLSRLIDVQSTVQQRYIKKALFRAAPYTSTSAFKSTLL